jgi:hypothetical protein
MVRFDSIQLQYRPGADVVFGSFPLLITQSLMITYDSGDTSSLDIA